jgi:hypothetical protein
LTFGLGIIILQGVSRRKFLAGVNIMDLYSSTYSANFEESEGQTFWDTLYGVLDTLYGVLDTLYGVLDTLYGGLDTLYGVLDTLYGVLDTVYGVLDTLYGGLHPVWCTGHPVWCTVLHLSGCTEAYSTPINHYISSYKKRW